MSAKDARQPLISVVIPAFRAESTIAECLQSLVDQRDAPPFEVIVVDSSPEDGTALAVEQFAASARPAGGALPPLHYQHLPERAFPGVARNVGVRLARGRELLFLDADCIAAPDLLAQVGAALQRGFAAVGGSIERVGEDSVSARLRHLLEFKESLPSVPARSTWQLPSACLAMDRDAFERHGGFPDVRASEDWLLDWKMWTAGERMAFEPTLRVRHRTRGGWRALARYCRLLGHASAVARRRGGLPGQLLVRWPILCLGLPVARTARAFAWCLRYDTDDLPFFVAAWPAYLAMASIWARGFHSGLRGAAPPPEPS